MKQWKKASVVDVFYKVVSKDGRDFAANLRYYIKPPEYIFEVWDVDEHIPVLVAAIPFDNAREIADRILEDCGYS